MAQPFEWKLSPFHRVRTMVRTQRERIGRFASVGLLSVLVVPPAFALWGTAATYQAGVAVKNATELSNSFERARFAVGEEERLDAHYSSVPSPALLALYRSAGKTVVEALHQAGTKGNTEDRQIINEVLALHAKYILSVDHMFSAVDANDTAAARAIDEREVDPSSDKIVALVGAAADLHRVNATDHLADLSAIQTKVLIATPAVFAMSVVLGFFFWRLMRIQRHRTEPFNIGDRPFFAGGSVGVAHTGSTETPKLIDAGDTALYIDKRQKNRAAAIKVPGRSDDQGDVTGEHASQSLECELRCAIERNQFLLHYQPLISSLTGEVVGFEALLRWQHPERGMIPPLEFIPLAEKSGLIIKIGQWVLQTACAAAASWKKPYWVAVNVSPAQFRSCDLPQTVSDILARTGLPANRLEIEVTESRLMEAPKLAADVLSALRALGVRIAMDDFGTGYSSLSYLHEFKFDKLKIDRSFVMRFGQTEDVTLIVSAIIGLARKLGLSIVAEGVETVQQLNALRDLGCDQIQGYLIARPIPLDDPSELLAACDWIHRESRERNLGEQRLGIANSETKAAAAEVEEGNRPLTRALNVLVVDDITMSRDIARSFLRAAGHCVVCVEGGAEAVAAAADNDFDVVLMDVCMPEMDGLEATRRVRALVGGRGQVPIVAVTAQAFAGQISECRKAGMNGHVSKPFGPEMLVAAVVRAAVIGPHSNSFGPEFVPIPICAAGMPPVIGADLPVLEPKVFDRTTAFLAPEAPARLSDHHCRAWGEPPAHIG